MDSPLRRTRTLQIRRTAQAVALFAEGAVPRSFAARPLRAHQLRRRVSSRRRVDAFLPSKFGTTLEIAIFTTASVRQGNGTFRRKCSERH